MKTSWLLIITIVFLSCTKEEDKGILQGNITGKVSLNNQYGYLESDGAGTTVTISNDKISKTGNTDANGYYTIPDLPFGSYNVQVAHDGYVSWETSSVNHIGGNNSTIANWTISQIPTFEIKLDSIVKIQNEYTLFGEFTSLIQKPRLGFYFACFLSDNSNVSKDNYKERIFAFAVMIDNSNQKIRVLMPYLDPILTYNHFSTIYIRLYPVVFGRFTEYGLDRYLGLPSNIISFKSE